MLLSSLFLQWVKAASFTDSLFKANLASYHKAYEWIRPERPDLPSPTYKVETVSDSLEPLKKLEEEFPIILNLDQKDYMQELICRALNELESTDLQDGEINNLFKKRLVLIRNELHVYQRLFEQSATEEEKNHTIEARKKREIGHLDLLFKVRSLTEALFRARLQANLLIKPADSQTVKLGKALLVGLINWSQVVELIPKLQSSHSAELYQGFAEVIRAAVERRREFRGRSPSKQPIKPVELQAQVVCEFGVQLTALIGMIRNRIESSSPCLQVEFHTLVNLLQPLFVMNFWRCIPPVEHASLLSLLPVGKTTWIPQGNRILIIKREDNFHYRQWLQLGDEACSGKINRHFTQVTGKQTTSRPWEVFSEADFVGTKEAVNLGTPSCLTLLAMFMAERTGNAQLLLNTLS